MVGAAMIQEGTRRPCAGKTERTLNRIEGRPRGVAEDAGSIPAVPTGVLPR